MEKICFQSKQAYKQATRKSSKKKNTTPLSIKNKPKFVGKLQGWQHCNQHNST